MTGIGAQDADMIVMHNAAGEFAASAGWVYAEARREANEDRRRAFDAMPDFGTPRGTALDFHPVTPTFVQELGYGIPAAWHR